MWLSKREAARRGSSTDVGMVSVQSESPAVVTDSEWRNAQVFGPGGYSWMPPVGQSVLVLKDGEGGAPCVVAAPVAGPVELTAGEVSVGTAAAYGYFQNDGTLQLQAEQLLAQCAAGAEIRGGTGVTLEAGRIDLNGAVYINGVSLEVLLSGE